MFDDSPQPKQVHILQLGFRAPKIWPLVGTPAVFPSQKPALAVVVSLGFLMGTHSRPRELAGTDPLLGLGVDADTGEAEMTKSEQRVSVLSLG